LIEIPRTEHAWALRAYLVLIGCAFRGETISDGELTQAIQCGNQLVLDRALKYVVRWCTLTNQPHIASLVVESITGMPAPSFSVVAIGAEGAVVAAAARSPTGDGVRDE
jgi:hypothetical protein